MSLALCSTGIAVAQEKSDGCRCKFNATDGYEADATKGHAGFSCTTSRKAAKSLYRRGCERRAAKGHPWRTAFENQYIMAPEILVRYIGYEQKGDKTRLLDPTFIESSLVVLERGAIFRKRARRPGFPLRISTPFSLTLRKSTARKLLRPSRERKVSTLR